MPKKYRHTDSNKWCCVTHQRVVKVTLFSISRFSRGPFSCAKDDMIHYLRWTVFLWIVNSIPFASGMAVNERIGMYAVTKSPVCLFLSVYKKGLIRSDYICLVFQAVFVSAREVNVVCTTECRCHHV